MQLKPSRYNHYTPAAGGRVIVFSKFCGSVTLLDDGDADALKSGELARLDHAALTGLEAAGFVVDAGADETAEAHARYLERKASNAALSLTVELGQACNLACPYCYQNSYRDSGTVITAEAVDRLERYAETVITAGKRPITDVALRFIGGEPLMQKDTVLSAAARFGRMAERLGVRLHAQIDTNGLLLDEAAVRALGAVSVTLTSQADHDVMRVRHNGSGTYTAILRKLRKLAPVFNDAGTVLAIRYNANALNARHVPEMYRLVHGIGIRRTEFDLFNTVNYDYNALIPVLTRDQFKKLYMELVRLKAEHGETITDFPRPTFAPCSAYTPWNVKVTAAGKLALCDAMSEDARHRPGGTLDDLSADIDAARAIFPEIAAHDPFTDEQCGTCTNIGICGGKLFCKTNPHADDSDPCDFLPFDMDEFLRFFAEAYPAMPERFDLASAAD